MSRPDTAEALTPVHQLRAEISPPEPVTAGQEDPRRYEPLTGSAWSTRRPWPPPLPPDPATGARCTVGRASSSPPITPPAEPWP